MEPVEQTVRIAGRTFRVEALPDAARGIWHAVVGEGDDPRRWSRLPLAYDSAIEALVAATGGIVRLVGGADPVAASDSARPRPRLRGADAPGGGPGRAMRHGSHSPTLA